MNRLAIALAAALSAPALAQTPPVTILEIDTENSVMYMQDVMDMSKWGTQSGPVPLDANANFRPFKERQTIADIVAVNGKPVKGLLTLVQKNMMAMTTLTPGRQIADLEGACVREGRFILLHPDGIPIGILAFSGSASTLVAPGAPSSVATGLDVVVGGTGVFLGARGQVGGVGGSRTASIAEDPAYRRVNGGTKIKWYVHLIAMTWPEVLTLPTGPAIYHGADFSPVTADKPARAGEGLIMSVSGLGPVKPYMDPGKPFPPEQGGKVHEVDSPVDVTVNGKIATVVNKIGWPAMTNVYRVDFVVPDGTPAGMATVGMSVAWINGPEVKIPVR